MPTLTTSSASTKPLASKAIGTVGSRRFYPYGVSHCQNSGFKNDGVTLQSLKVAAAIEALVVLMHRLSHRLGEINRTKHLITHLHMALNQGHFPNRQGSGLGQ